MRAGSDESSPIQLRVAEAKHRDVGKRRARIDLRHMEHLGIHAGEVVCAADALVGLGPLEDELFGENGLDRREVVGCHKAPELANDGLGRDRHWHGGSACLTTPNV